MIKIDETVNINAFTEQENSKINEALLKSEADITEGRTIDARQYLRDKISKLEETKHI